ncbi:hypothetical protein [Intrasporangium sp.]|uniref:hypothetical protein n=1 Tax=Intrasporangium sp. TaxID=1925024 RepID=UPI0033653210
MTVKTLQSAHHPTPQRTPSARSRVVRAVIVLALLGLVAIGARLVLARGSQDVRSGTEAVSADVFATRSGIAVDLIAVTAAGGLVEFRYQVVDPDKAARLVHDETLRPILVVEDTGATLVMSSRPHRTMADLQLGGTYFFLFANANNAVREGNRVTIIIGDVRLEHVVAKA